MSTLDFTSFVFVWEEYLGKVSNSNKTNSNTSLFFLSWLPQHQERKVCMKLMDVISKVLKLHLEPAFLSKYNLHFAKNLNSSDGVNSWLSFSSGNLPSSHRATQDTPKVPSPNVVIPISPSACQNSSNILKYVRAHHLYNLQVPPCQSKTALREQVLFSESCGFLVLDTGSHLESPTAPISGEFLLSNTQTAALLLPGQPGRAGSISWHAPHTAAKPPSQKQQEIKILT